MKQIIRVNGKKLRPGHIVKKTHQRNGIPTLSVIEKILDIGEKNVKLELISSTRSSDIDIPGTISSQPKDYFAQDIELLPRDSIWTFFKKLFAKRTKSFKVGNKIFRINNLVRKTYMSGDDPVWSFVLKISGIRQEDVKVGLISSTRSSDIDIPGTISFPYKNYFEQNIELLPRDSI